MKSALSAEEQAVLHKLQRDVAKPSAPVAADVRRNRFVGDPVGMDERGKFFAIPLRVVK